MDGEKAQKKGRPRKGRSGQGRPGAEAQARSYHRGSLWLVDQGRRRASGMVRGSSGDGDGGRTEPAA